MTRACAGVAGSHTALLHNRWCRAGEYAQKGFPRRCHNRR